MKDRTKQNLSGVISFFAVLFLVVVVFIVGISISVPYKQVEKICDKEYGVGNWTLNETTGTGSYRWFIGQVWECVKNEG